MSSPLVAQPYVAPGLCYIFFMASCIYLIYNKVNGKIYVGKSNDFEGRWSEHLKVARGGKATYPTSFSTIHAAICKYGEENFVFKIVEELPSEQEALTREAEWVSTLRATGVQLYNLTDGGEGSSGYKHTPQSLEKMRECNLGENNPRFGTTHTRESRKKMSDKIRAKSDYFSKMWSGENNPNAKLTLAQTEEIIQLLDSGMTQVSVAKLFSISQPQVSKIYRKRLSRSPA